jgi:hypothetical protein
MPKREDPFELNAAVKREAMKPPGDPDRELQQGPGGPTDQGRCLKVKPDAIWQRPGGGGAFASTWRGSRHAL